MSELGSSNMLRCFERSFPLPGRQIQLEGLRFLFVVGLIICMVSGCSSNTSKHEFEFFGLSRGFSLEIPRNWNATYDERSNSVTLLGESGMFHSDSASILIQPGTTAPTSSSLIEHLEAGIEITGVRFDLNPVTIIEEPTIIENEKYEMAMAIVSVPFRQNPEDGFQILEMRAVRCPNTFVMMYIYKRNNERLNTEAEAIADSIELNCLIEP